jgi:uncharacterized protein
MTFWLIYLAAGAFSGVLAGLLGVGGGVVIVPILLYIFTAQQMPPQFILHLALGTSLACILFSSISSLRSHHKKGAVDWQVFRRVTPGILVGTFVGSWVAAQLSTRFLKGFFIVFLYYISVQMLLNMKPKPSRQLPEAGGMFGVGSVIGGVCSLVGIGGGSMSVPFLTWCNVSLRNAIGTSAAIGFPIALAGAAGYVVNGLAVSALPAYSFGFVYLPALAGIAVVSALTAPLGVHLAHNLPVALLKKLFAALLLVVATKMLMGI